MKAFRANAGVRIAVVIATLLSLGVLSNHCALGGMSNAPAVHQCCAKAAPAKDDSRRDDGRVMECCKTIRAMVADGQFAIDPPLSQAPLPFQYRCDPRFHPFAIALHALPSTGPPDSGGFLTAVLLKHSLPALAPPVAA